MNREYIYELAGIRARAGGKKEARERRKREEREKEKEKEERESGRDNAGEPPFYMGRSGEWWTVDGRKVGWWMIDCRRITLWIQYVLHIGYSSTGYFVFLRGLDSDRVGKS